MTVDAEVFKQGQDACLERIEFPWLLREHGGMDNREGDHGEKSLPEMSLHAGELATMTGDLRDRGGIYLFNKSLIPTDRCRVAKPQPPLEPR